MNEKEMLESIKETGTRIVRDEDFCVYSERTPKKTDWLWEPYILRGNLTAIVGEGGVGKSYFTSWLAATISSGGFVPFKPYRFHMERVFLQNGEDDVDSTTLPRLISNGANTNNIGFFTEDKKILCVQQIDRIEDLLKEYKPALVILDPIQAYLGNINMNAMLDVRNSLKPLQKLAQKYNTAIVIIMHTNKNTGTTKATNRVMGSYDFIAACRTVLMIENDPENREVKLLMPLKSNLMKECEKHTLSFRIIDSGKLEWLKNLGYVNPNEILFENNNSTINKSDKAEQYILGILSRGEILGTELKNLAINVGKISEHTFNTTKLALNKERKIKNYRKGKPSYWALNIEIEGNDNNE